MKIVHLSDLHLGKLVNGINMLDDQKYIFERILDALKSERPDALIIAGDVYDRSIPSAEAVTFFDEFLNKVTDLEKSPKMFIISGNHDSSERLAFGNRLIAKTGVHLSPVFDGNITPIVMKDEFGEVAFYMLPFIKPADARNAYPDEKIETYTDALKAAIGHLQRDDSRRNVLIAHQFVTGAERSESEDVVIGGLDNVDASVFCGFDYVALGHLHRPQAVPGNENIRYCGTPLKYSISEENDQKSILIVEMAEKGTVNYRTIPLIPLHDIRTIRGKYNELASRENYIGTNTDDYIHVVLTDEEDVIDAMGRLRTIYPNIMKLDYDNKRTSHGGKIEGIENIDKKSDMEILEELYKLQNNQPISDEQRSFAEKLFNDIQEGRA